MDRGYVPRSCERMYLVPSPCQKVDTLKHDPLHPASPVTTVEGDSCAHEPKATPARTRTYPCSVRVLRVFHSAVVDGWRARERELRSLGHYVHLISAQRWN